MADRLDALTVRESNGKSYWTRIGVGWPNKNGPGYIVRLDAIPAPTDGQFVIHLREPQPRDQQSNGGTQRRQQPTNGGRGGWDDETDAPF